MQQLCDLMTFAKRYFDHIPHRHSLRTMAIKFSRRGVQFSYRVRAGPWESCAFCNLHAEQGVVSGFRKWTTHTKNQERMAFRTKKPKSSDILVSHHDQICVILSTTDTILLPFTNKLFEKHIIDRSTKNEISHKAGYKAADTLLDCLEMRVDANPSLLQTVFEVMREVDTLTDVVEKMERMEKEWLAKQEDMQGIPLTGISVCECVLNHILYCLVSI